jgi:hypothetical protein
MLVHALWLFGLRRYMDLQLQHVLWFTEWIWNGFTNTAIFQRCCHMNEAYMYNFFVYVL